MNFQNLVEQILFEEDSKSSKKLFKVVCHKHGVTGRGPDDLTRAFSKEQAIAQVAVKHARNAGWSKEAYGRLINDFKKHSVATLIPENP